jgi:hypothetical protein
VGHLALVISSAALAAQLSTLCAGGNPTVAAQPSSPNIQCLRRLAAQPTPSWAARAFTSCSRFDHDFATTSRIPDAMLAYRGFR